MPGTIGTGLGCQQPESIGHRPHHHRTGAVAKQKGTVLVIRIVDLRVDLRRHQQHLAVDAAGDGGAGQRQAVDKA